MPSPEAPPAPQSSESSESPEESQETLDLRKTALEELSVEPIPKDVFDQVDDFFDKRMPQLSEGAPHRDVIDNYLAAEANQDRLDALIYELRRKPMMEVLDTMRAAGDASYDWETVRALAAIMNRSVRPNNESWGALPGDSDAQKEQAKQQIRVSEMLFLETRMDELKDPQRVKEKGPEFVRQVQQSFERYQELPDVPEFFKRRLAEAKSVEQGRSTTFAESKRLELDQKQPTAKEETPPVKKSPAEIDAQLPPERQLKVQQPEAATTPEEASKTPTPERVFNREVLTPEQVRTTSKEIRGQLESGTPEGAYQAARQLAQLKRAGLALQNPRAMKFASAQLERQLQHWREQSPRELGSYLSNLKYLGVIDAVADEDKQALSLAAIKAAEQNNTNDLSQLAVWNKYLGITESLPDSMKEKLQADVRAKLQAGEKPRAALRLARLDYLGVESGLTEQETQSIYSATSSRANKQAAAGRWDSFTRLHNVLDRLRGTDPLPQDAQNGIVSNLQQQAAASNERGRWEPFASFYADAVKLSRLKDDAPEIENPGDAMSFLSSLERSHAPAETPEEYFKRAGEAARERAADVFEGEVQAGSDETIKGSAEQTQVNAEQSSIRAAFERAMLDELNQERARRTAEQSAAPTGQPITAVEKTWRNLPGRLFSNFREFENRTFEIPPPPKGRIKRIFHWAKYGV